MGTDCAPLLANLYLHYYEYKYLSELIHEEEYVHDDAKKFNNIYRYIDDLVVINNTEFSNEISNIYPDTLKLTQQGAEDNERASYLDLDINIVDNKFDIKVFDKRDNFNFIINSFPYVSSNVYEKNILNVYISQLVRYGRICTNREDFFIKHRYLTNKLLSNGFKLKDLIKRFKLFTIRHNNILRKWNYKKHHNAYYIKRGILNI
jgi:hypothetical protein